MTDPDRAKGDGPSRTALHRERSLGSEPEIGRAPDDRAATTTEKAPGRSRTVLAVVVPVAVVLVAFIGLLATGEPAANRITESTIVGRLVPPTAGPTLDGDTFDIERQEGRWVLVNFFATWCAPCVAEHDDLAAFAERHQATGDATVVSVVYGDEEADASAFFDERGGDWSVIVGDPLDLGRIALDYGVTGVPESYLIAPSGVVVAKIVGGITAEGLEQILANAVAGRPLDS